MNTPKELELMKSLEQANKEVVKLREELAEERRKAEMYKCAFETGSDLMMFMKGLVDAGFTQEQAFSIIMAQMK